MILAALIAFFFFCFIVFILQDKDRRKAFGDNYANNVLKHLYFKKVEKTL